MEQQLFVVCLRTALAPFIQVRLTAAAAVEWSGVRHCSAPFASAHASVPRIASCGEVMMEWEGKGAA